MSDTVPVGTMTGTAGVTTGLAHTVDATKVEATRVSTESVNMLTMLDLGAGDLVSTVSLCPRRSYMS